MEVARDFLSLDVRLHTFPIDCERCGGHPVGFNLLNLVEVFSQSDPCMSRT
jgi:hypothetical protein